MDCRIFPRLLDCFRASLVYATSIRHQAVKCSSQPKQWRCSFCNIPRWQCIFLFHWTGTSPFQKMKITWIYPIMALPGVNTNDVIRIKSSLVICLPGSSPMSWFYSCINSFKLLLTSSYLAVGLVNQFFPNSTWSRILCQSLIYSSHHISLHCHMSSNQYWITILCYRRKHERWNCFH